LYWKKKNRVDGRLPSVKEKRKKREGKEERAIVHSNQM
jgi:hypothetical protein